MSVRTFFTNNEGIFHDRIYYNSNKKAYKKNLLQKDIKIRKNPKNLKCKK
jgi:hypothetical protein